MTDEEFEEIVRAALDSLPEEIARGLENVAVVVEDEDPESPEILGIFSGYPRGETMPSGALPAKIVIYRRPLEAYVPGSRRAAPPDPNHRPPRARALLRIRRGPARRPRLRIVDLALNAIAIAAAIVGGIVILLFFFGSRD